MTPDPKARFEQRVVRPLAAKGRSLRRQIAVEGVLWCLALGVAAGAVQFAADRLLVLGLGPRIVLLAAIVGLLAWHVLRRVLRPAAVPVDATDVAALLERRDGSLGDQLVSAVAFACAARLNPHRDSPAMVERLYARAAERFESLAHIDLLRRDRHRRFVAAGFAAAALSVAAGAYAPDLMTAYLERNWLLRDRPWPTRTRIEVRGFEDGRLAWPLGDDLILVAIAHDRVPDSLRAEFELASGRQESRPMDRQGERGFILSYGPLPQSLRVRFLIGRFGVDERTEWYHVNAIERPMVRSATIEITPPGYTGQAAYALATGQVSSDILRGSQARITARMNKPIASAVLRSRADHGQAAGVTIDEGARLVSEFMPQRSGTYFFDVRDEAGLEDTHPVTYSFNLLSDPPPRVRLSLPGAGELIVPTAVPTLVVECDDNLGMESVELAWRVAASRDTTTQPALQQEPLPEFVPGQTRYALEREWPLQRLTLHPGDQLTLVVRATDRQPVIVPPTQPQEAHGEPQQALPTNTGESQTFTLRIVTVEELLTELGRREHEWRREFEQIIKAQEQLQQRIALLRDDDPAVAASADRSIRYGQESRAQRQQINRMKTVHRQFEQLYAELRVNQLATPTVRRRLDGGVLRPLVALINHDVPDVADQIERLRMQYDATLAQRLDEQITQLVRSMYAILAEMLKWEGYNEAVGLLREIVRLQDDVTDDTRARLEKEIERLFGGESSSEPQAPAGEESGNDDPSRSREPER